MENADEKLSAAERRRRRQAIDYARASVALEGFTLSEDVEQAFRRHVEGEIDLETLRDMLNGTMQTPSEAPR